MKILKFTLQPRNVDNDNDKMPPQRTYIPDTNFSNITNNFNFYTTTKKKSYMNPHTAIQFKIIAYQ